MWLVREAILLLYPRTGDLPGAIDCDIDAFLERFRRETPWRVWLGVVLGAIVFHVSPIFTVHVPLPAFLLPAGLADRHAHRISNTNVYLARQAIFVLKLPAGMLWGTNAAVRARLALPPLDEDPGTWKTS